MRSCCSVGLRFQLSKMNKFQSSTIQHAPVVNFVQFNFVKRARLILSVLIGITKQTNKRDTRKLWEVLGMFITLKQWYHRFCMMATHSSVLAWRIPGTGEPGRLPSVGHTESDTTEETQQQQQAHQILQLFFYQLYLKKAVKRARIR